MTVTLFWLQFFVFESPTDVSYMFHSEILLRIFAVHIFPLSEKKKFPSLNRNATLHLHPSFQFQYNKSKNDAFFTLANRYHLNEIVKCVVAQSLCIVVSQIPHTIPTYILCDNHISLVELSSSSLSRSLARYSTLWNAFRYFGINTKNLSVLVGIGSCAIDRVNVSARAHTPHSFAFMCFLRFIIFWTLCFSLLAQFQWVSFC